MKNILKIALTDRFFSSPLHRSYQSSVCGFAILLFSYWWFRLRVSSCILTVLPHGGMPVLSLWTTTGTECGSPCAFKITVILSCQTRILKKKKLARTFCLQQLFTCLNLVLHPLLELWLVWDCNNRLIMVLSVRPLFLDKCWGPRNFFK